MIDVLDGKYLGILKERKDVGLYENLETICKVVEPYIDALPHQGGSLTGLNHIRGILREIENLTERSPYLNLTSTEIFILLAAILLHDIGKLKEDEYLIDEAKLDELISLLKDKLKLELDGNSIISQKPNPHPLISAVQIMESPTQFGIFDRELARMIAIVTVSHLKNFKTYFKGNKDFLQDRYLAKYGKIRISWLCALLVIGDELDTSYHRAVANDFSGIPQSKRVAKPKSSKGEFRANIGGCRIDLVGRCIVVHPIGDLKENIKENQYTTLLYKNFAMDIIGKNRLLNEWSHELRQMYIGVQSCLVEVDGHIYMVLSNCNRDSEFVLSVEPAITYFKVSRVIEAMFRLKYGVFKKKYFSWEMLQSEAGFESKEDLKSIVHRLSRLSTPFSGLVESVLDDIFKDSDERPNFELEIQELNEEWTITVSLLNLIYEYEKIFKKYISSWFLFFVESIIETRSTKELQKSIKSLIKKKNEEDVSYSLILKNKSERITVKKFFIRPGNKQLTYLLDEVSPCPTLLPRGIELPLSGAVYIDKKSGNNQKNEDIVYYPRIMGINLVIAGPPGIGKSTLALDIIDNLSLVGCNFECHPEAGDDGEKGCRRVITNAGAVAYFSLEQPIFTIESLADRMGKLGMNGEGDQKGMGRYNPDVDYNIEECDFKFDIQILQSKFFDSPDSSFSEVMEERDREYKDLFKGKEVVEERDREYKDTRILLLPRLSPRFLGEMSQANERKLFWQRFKQISRLIESSFSATRGDPFNQYRLHAIVVDNLNSFLNEPMAREYIFKLFRLISSSGILGVFILEDMEDDNTGISRGLEDVEFLADIWIKLGWTKKLDYKFKMLEVKKSRYQRHVFGSHPFKIRLEEVAS
jgi:predicted HD phosphohydrolase